MIKTKIRWMIAAACCIVSLSGCTKSNIVIPETSVGEEPAPDFNLYNNIVLDEEQLKNEMEEIYLDPNDYPMASNVQFELHIDEGYINIDVAVKDDTSAKDAAWYTGEAIKGLNDLIAEQDYNYGTSDEDTFGGVYQDNKIQLRVYKESAFTSGGEPFYTAEIPEDEFVTFEFEDVMK